MPSCAVGADAPARAVVPPAAPSENGRHSSTAMVSPPVRPAAHARLHAVTQPRLHTHALRAIWRLKPPRAIAGKPPVCALFRPLRKHAIRKEPVAAQQRPLPVGCRRRGPRARARHSELEPSRVAQPAHVADGRPAAAGDSVGEAGKTGANRPSFRPPAAPAVASPRTATGANPPPPPIPRHHAAHICTGTGLTPPAFAWRLGSSPRPLSALRDVST